MHAWADVAHLVKTKNLDGRFVVHATAGLPLLLEEGDEVAFVPPQLDTPRKAVVQDIRFIDEYSAEILFDCIDGNAAHALVGAHCLIPRDCIDDSVFEEAPGMWDGWTVADAALGTIGHVAGLVDNPAQALLQVERPDGSLALVPVVDDIVCSVDVDKRIVHVELPVGLLDL